MYITFILAFILLLSAWIRFELKLKVSLFKHWKWLLLAAVFQLSAEVIAYHMKNEFLGNIILHGVGGGVTSTFLFFYLVDTFKIRTNWRIQLALLFAFVSTLGVMNELMEFTFELLQVGVFSVDTHDTWRDFAANTTGALIAWAAVQTYAKLLKKPIP